jgi:UDP-GlcNAc:undecaprenyl-phosphate GlcNAc-1-phosphate transferase
MILLCLAMIPVALLVSLAATWAARALGRRLQAMDGAGVRGQVKEAPRLVPNIGGVGIFLGFAIPLALLVTDLSHARPDPSDFSMTPADLQVHLEGVRARAGDAWMLLGATLILHVLGLVDDRRPLGPFLKLAIMLGVVGGAMIATGTRLCTFLDGHAGGPWLSYALSVLWVCLVTNAMNFLDNMDGLAGGVGAVAGACFLAIALLQGQWFVGAALALLVGATLGFLWFNKPRASIFMGDGGSLVLGFLLAFLSVRITYVPLDGSGLPRSGVTAWHAVLTPLVVLAVPLYDFIAVVALRLSQGKSPFVGDLQHVSHRLVRRGLSRALAVLVIVGFAAASGLSGVLLTRVDSSGAVLVGVQMLSLMIVLAVMEFGGSGPDGATSP